MYDGVYPHADLMCVMVCVLHITQAVTIRTALLVTAIDLSSLIDSYCMVYTDNPHSRLTGVKRFSNSQM